MSRNLDVLSVTDFLIMNLATNALHCQKIFDEISVQNLEQVERFKTNNTEYQYYKQNVAVYKSYGLPAADPEIKHGEEHIYWCIDPGLGLQKTWSHNTKLCMVYNLFSNSYMKIVE